ncbi:MAG: HD domain-containing protein [Aristaeellaceae bacterium]
MTGGEHPPQDWTLRHRIFDEGRMYDQVKARAAALGLRDTLRVLPLARQWHAGQYRKGEGDIPYISHPLTMACHALAMGLAEDGLMCAILLHDVPEDCGVPVEELPVPPRVQRTIARLTYRCLEDESREEARRRYYAEIRRDPDAMLVKLLDRCCNVSGMAEGFTRARMAGYVRETEEHVLPLFALLEAQAPAYADALWLMRYQLLSLLETFKRLL